MLGSRGVSGVNHKRSAGPNAQRTSTRSVLNMAIAALEMFEMLEPSLSTSCSDGRPTCTQSIPEVPSRYQAFKRCLFAAKKTQWRRNRLGSFRSGFVLFFCFGCFCHFGFLMFGTGLENTIKCSVYHYWCTRSSSMQMPACLHALFSIPKFNLPDSDSGRHMSNLVGPCICWGRVLQMSFLYFTRLSLLNLASFCHKKNEAFAVVLVVQIARYAYRQKLGWANELARQLYVTLNTFLCPALNRKQSCSVWYAVLVWHCLLRFWLILGGSYCPKVWSCLFMIVMCTGGTLLGSLSECRTLDCLGMDIASQQKTMSGCMTVTRNYVWVRFSQLKFRLLSPLVWHWQGCPIWIHLTHIVEMNWKTPRIGSKLFFCCWRRFLIVYIE